jgi:uncharacterized protein involved in high-affinity Fe2+ transport
MSKMSTQFELVLEAACHLTNTGKTIFRRADIKNYLVKKYGITDKEWQNNYSAVFQGMRADKPTEHGDVSQKYRNVFEKILWQKIKYLKT